MPHQVLTANRLSDGVVVFLDANGRCDNCGTAIPGMFEAQPGDWGSKRQRVDMTRFSNAY